MLDPKQLDELARRFTESLPPGMREFQQEVERNVRAAMQSAFARMDLITRDEFDAQAKTLARTRARLQELEKQVAALESTLKTPAPGEPTATSKATGKPATRRTRGTGKNPQASND
ncbi:MAG: accessory factor UbiK family protein [Nitrococcus mobilis]|nr:accessory factor UbiK family protein [Nitrococcus mobilis]